MSCRVTEPKVQQLGIAYREEILVRGAVVARIDGEVGACNADVAECGGRSEGGGQVVRDLEVG